MENIAVAVAIISIFLLGIMALYENFQNAKLRFQLDNERRANKILREKFKKAIEWLMTQEF